MGHVGLGSHNLKTPIRVRLAVTELAYAVIRQGEGFKLNRAQVPPWLRLGKFPPLLEPPLLESLPALPDIDPLRLIATLRRAVLLSACFRGELGTAHGATLSFGSIPNCFRH